MSQLRIKQIKDISVVSLVNGDFLAFNSESGQFVNKPAPLNGTNGVNGTSGVNGANGTSGVNGANGTSGVNGAAGANGTSGVNGATGATGATGPVAGSANQVVFKNASNAAAGDSNFTYTPDGGLLLGRATIKGSINFKNGMFFVGPNDNDFYQNSGNVVTIGENIIVPDAEMEAPVPMMWDQVGNAIGFQTSSIRFKENVEDLTLNINDFLSRTAKTYNTKGSKRPDVGFIAEEWFEFDEKLVGRDKEGLINTLHYDKMTPYLYETVKLLYKEIKELKAEITLLKK